jgi:ribonuclease H / adenosylcobalamin/alpha-ribazole phosphatase
VDDLGENRFGAWEGLTFEELESREDWRRFNTMRSRVRPPGGETMIEVQTRMVRQLECLASRHPDEPVAVVSHCDPLRAVLAHYLGVPLDHLLRFAIDPASVSAVELGAWAPRIVSLNGTGDIAI